jgi:hypothetical protein
MSFGDHAIIRHRIDNAQEYPTMSGMEHVYQIIEQYPADSLLPHSAVKDCIAVLEASDTPHAGQLEVLRSQIGIIGSDDTRMFSMQLTAAKLKEKLESL